MTDVSSTAPIVSIRGVNKRFKGQSGQPTVALQDVSLEILPGEFVSLIGPSGCGKSTLLRLIGDLLQPTTGEVIVNGKPAHKARTDRDYGMVFQAAVLYDWRTVQKNVELPLEVMNFPAAERTRRAKEMLKLVELSDFPDHYPWQLSGGMQQRVAIARALAFEPKLLLMDEPFGALDEMTRDRLNNELLSIWAKTRKTIVFVTHSIQEAVYLSSRVVIMSPRPGRISQIVPITLSQPRGPETRDSQEFFHLVTRVREGLRGLE
jgi:NitT/TauT family transport system ATP-binding protein